MTPKPAKPDVELLSSIGLFKELRPAALRRIRAAMQPAAFEAGEVIMAKDDAASWARFYLVLGGTAEVLTADGQAATLGPGDTFGEISVLDGLPRSATVSATSRLEAASLSSENLRELLLEEPTITYQLLVEACRRLRAAESAQR
jgi:CRP/FNR family cyclic AMP-dependent transcriptional regulator